MLGLPQTQYSARRARDARLRSLRDFADAHGWAVVGVFADFSSPYPVEPLLGARSAQPELAIGGAWDRWSASAALTCVRDGSYQACPTRMHRCDVEVLLTTLQFEGDSRQFTAKATGVRPDVVALTRAAQEWVGRIEAVLREAADHGDLHFDDHLALDERELLHVRVLKSNQRVVDVESPLRCLERVCAALT